MRVSRRKLESSSWISAILLLTRACDAQERKVSASLKLAQQLSRLVPSLPGLVYSRSPRCPSTAVALLLQASTAASACASYLPLCCQDKQDWPHKDWLITSTG